MSDLLKGFADRFNCPVCGTRLAITLDSRVNKDNRRRRYQCWNGHRYTTRERLEAVEDDNLTFYESDH